MTATDELLEANEAYVASFDKGELPLPARRKRVAIVACMDARLNVVRRARAHRRRCARDSQRGRRGHRR